MKLVLAACLLLSLVSVSHQFINGLGHLKLGIVGGAKLGIFKSGSRVAPLAQVRRRVVEVCLSSDVRM